MEKTTEEIIATINNLLMVLKKRWEETPKNIEFKQTKEYLAKNNNGAPLDRKGWLYLPFLEEISNQYQPPEDGDGKLYKTFLSPGEVVKIADLTLIVTKGEKKKVSIGPSYIEGPFELKKTRP